MSHIIFFAFLFIASALFALAEIQIEGENGWASKLPTWRFTIKSVYAFLNREITGYHTYIFALVLFLPHFIFVILPWSLSIELYILSFYFLLNSLEDFLWFILNPKYGIKKFNAKHVHWHKIWFMGLPFDYWITIPLGINLYLIASII